MKRVMPARQLSTIIPLHTKCYHVGVVGAHSTPEIYFKAPDFDAAVPEQRYKEIT